jgi:hypothetical protein
MAARSAVDGIPPYALVVYETVGSFGRLLQSREKSESQTPSAILIPDAATSLALMNEALTLSRRPRDQSTADGLLFGAGEATLVGVPRAHR